MCKVSGDQLNIESFKWIFIKKYIACQELSEGMLYCLGCHNNWFKQFKLSDHFFQVFHDFPGQWEPCMTS